MLFFFAFASLLLVFSIDPVACLYKRPTLSECDITFTSIYLCPDITGYGDVSVNLKTINDEGGKALDLSVTITEPLSEEYKMSLRIDAYDNGQWKENIHHFQDSLCSFVTKYATKGWEHIREAVIPPLELECAAEPGLYQLSDFTATPNEVNMPTSLFGKFRLILNVYDPAEELFVCRVVEVEIAPKSPF